MSWPEILPWLVGLVGLMMVALFGLLALLYRMNQRIGIMQQALSKQEEILNTPMEIPQEFLGQLKEQIKVQTALITQTAATLNSEMETICQRIEETGLALQARAQQNAQLADNMHEQMVNDIARMDGMNKALGQTHESLEVRLQNHLGEMEGEINRLHDTIERFDKTGEHLEQKANLVQENLSNHLHEAERFDHQLTQSLEALQKTQQTVNEDAKAAVSAIESQRLDLNAATSQARKGAEHISIIIDEAVKKIANQQDGFAQNIENAMQGLDTLRNAIQTQTHELTKNAQDVEQSLFSQSQNVIVRLNKNVQEFVNIGLPMMERAEGINQQFSHHNQQFEVAGKLLSEQIDKMQDMQNLQSPLQSKIQDNLVHYQGLLQGFNEIGQQIDTNMQQALQQLLQIQEHNHGEVEGVEQNISRLGEQLNQLMHDLQHNVQKNSQQFSQHIGMLNKASLEAEKRLTGLNDRFESLTERLTSGSVAAGLQFSDHQTMLEQLSVRLNQVAQDTSQLIEKALKNYQVSESDLLASKDKVEAGWEGLSKRLRLQIDEIQDIHQHANKQLADISEALAGQREWLEQSIELADNGMGQLQDNIQSQSRSLIDGVNQTIKHLEKTTGGFEAKTRKLNEIGKHALDEAMNIKDQYDIEARDLFNRTSRHIIDDLNSISIDLTRALEGEVPEADWHRYVKGDKTIFSRSLLRNRQDALVRKIADRVRSDYTMRGYVARYVELFEHLLAGAQKSDSENLLQATFLTSDVGKLYAILHQALGKGTQ